MGFGKTPARRLRSTGAGEWWKTKTGPTFAEAGPLLVEGSMAQRVTNAELRDRIDGLGIAFFAVTGALVEALAEVHPDDKELWARLTARAIAMVLELREIEQDAFTDDALDQAYTAVLAAFTSQRKAEASNDNG